MNTKTTGHVVNTATSPLYNDRFVLKLYALVDPGTLWDYNGVVRQALHEKSYNPTAQPRSYYHWYDLLRDRRSKLENYP